MLEVQRRGYKVIREIEVDSNKMAFAISRFREVDGLATMGDRRDPVL